MKKKIIFCTYSLGIGGIEKCLVNLVNQLDYNLFDITIATMNPNYEFAKEINPKIRIIRFEEYFYNTRDSYPIIKNYKGIKKITQLSRYIVYRVAVKTRLYPWKIQKKMREKYDIAVSYSHIDQVPYYTIDRINAKTKILWYHSLWIDKRAEKYYSKYDHIVAVSEFCKKNFIHAFPLLKEKVCVKYNIYDFDAINQLSKQPIKGIAKNKISILTVARLSQEKGYLLAIKACEILKNSVDADFCWFWLGDGPDCENAQNLIKEKKLESYFCLLGSTLNPYPYFSACDIYVQPSLLEAYCTTVVEAMHFKKPLVVTDVGSFREQVEHQKNALIAEQNEADLAKKISLLVTDKQLRSVFSKNCNVNDLPINNINNYNCYFEEV